ncbi:hypothetical protein [Clostridium rectalis]|uniref:hypothetical protein n=1 Tax=Clostridium rectalis TaxID=2040295 RepID=UPI000F63F3EB|nr:hypothetical protein [Clostridium rectalis]
MPECSKIKFFSSGNLNLKKYPNDLNSIVTLNPNFVCAEYGEYDQCNYYVEEKRNKFKINLTNKIRMLSSQHTAWIRMLITSIITDSKDEKFIAKRLIKNLVDINMVLKEFYLESVVVKLSELVKNHIEFTIRYIKAVNNESKKEADSIEIEWKTNAIKVANLLKNFNSHCDKNYWEVNLERYLGLIKSEIVYILNKDYEKSIIIYDEIEKQNLYMADTIIEAILK